MEMTNDMAGQPDATTEDTPQSTLALVTRIQDTVRRDKEFHKKAFERMKRDMFVAYHGRDDTWPEANYRANLAGRHVKQKTAALYAKNPKVTAKRRETLDFSVWDENPQSLMTAMQGIQMAQQAMAQTPMRADPMTGQPVPAQSPVPPEFEQALQQATTLVQDFQQGMQRRQLIKRIGKTLEVLVAQAMREQKPQDFKRLAKTIVRRACTTGVGYIELGYQREYGPRPGLAEQLADVRSRLDHLRRLTEEAMEGEIEEDDAERAELELALQTLTSEPEVVLREGLVYDAPQSTKVIPDMLCRQLNGFVGARHITIEYLFTAEQVEELFEGAKLEKGKFTGYGPDGKADSDDKPSANRVDDEGSSGSKKGRDLVCVWKHYEKASGLCYYVADGYKEFLRPPAAPDVFVEDFWPVYSLSFNEVENEDELFPPSDVTLMLDMQREYNRARQGMREHRDAARPRWTARRGVFSDDDVNVLKNLKPFEIGFMDLAQEIKIGDALEEVPIRGVDPNLYETGQLFTDTQLVVGSQEAQFGGVSKATATESAIAANSSASSDGSSIDDLDGFLTTVMRASGQVLLREMSEERVMQVAGTGAVWPHLTLAEIADEIFLEVEAGSTGKPNQAIELENWNKLLPYIIQMPNVDPTWLARETLRRLDDRMDLTEAITEGLPSIVMQNASKQPGTGNAATDPAAQGGEGGNNGPPPPGGPAGTSAAFGSNQV